jgi:hypothetical protein
MVLVVFVACTCSVVTGDGDSGAARQILFAACPDRCARDAWGACYDGLVFFVLLASPMSHVLLLIPRSSQ